MDEKMQDKNAKLQKVNVPKYIKWLSLIYIVATVVSGLFMLMSNILETGHATISQMQYAVKILGDVILGLVFWGIGQVFSKLLENNK